MAERAGGGERFDVQPKHADETTRLTRAAEQVCQRRAQHPYRQMVGTL